MNSLGRTAIAALATAVLLQWGSAAATTTAGGFTEATAPYTFSFPRDHAAHDGYRTEWWYFTGHLRAGDGHRFGYELTFFRIGIAPHATHMRPGESRWHGTQLYPAHFAITDERSGRFVYYEDFARDALAQGRASPRRLDVRVHDWTLRGPMPFSLHASKGGDGIDLAVNSRKPPAIHGVGGISRKGACRSCASHYYSYTRLATTGRIRVQNHEYGVRGISWMDHEYGSDELQGDQIGWDWFSMQLNDGREVMLYRLRQRDGSTTPQSSGSLIARSGSVRFLPLRAFTIRATEHWISPHTTARYPSAWTVHVDGVGDLIITPQIADQELVNASNGVTYWEGSVAIRSPNGKPLGVGYVELTGYAQPVNL
ncbi:MAG: carotenoid 1,2-hydratase [Candidatus Eremiobacteraeota bacterium]|nr:carotenoid 1,2-hydratase [Candidatus Eremiobacteraeota bacterium]